MRSIVLAVVLVFAAGLSAEAASFSQCVAGLKNAAIKAGVSRGTARKALDGAKESEKVLRFSRQQPEFQTPIWDYMAFLVDEQRVADGKRMMRKYDRVLRRAEKQFGVNRYVIAAVWGVESDYGRETGDNFLPHALATLACNSSRRRDFWRGELISALRIVDRGEIRMKDLYGSWAGAFGQTQFIPSTYLRLAVDFDGDGKRDLVNSAADALGSTANYLKNAGWRRGETFMIEAKVKPGYKGPRGRNKRSSLGTWAQRGVTKADGSRISGGGSAGLLLPAGSRGPAFLVFRNFNAIYSYNNAETYALAISHLADRLAGYPALRTPWPTNDPGLSRAERLQLQKLLLANGYDIGKADGKIGPITKRAIAAAERSYGMKPTGRAGRTIYLKLGGR